MQFIQRQNSHDSTPLSYGSVLFLPRFSPKNQRFGKFYFSLQPLLFTFIQFQFYRFSLSNPFNEVKEGYFFALLRLT
ncbi:hypothetical protein DVG78_07640 [Runella aurantiaca]|uniref:Uncharacterized protein n=1 Tax=Runella aurantiaca TaxID=2282308 RepID=A0A369IC29_9BACT|nr:hypothetical protein DVG78_07640 [Runella aurantiaca]